MLRRHSMGERALASDLDFYVGAMCIARDYALDAACRIAINLGWRPEDCAIGTTRRPEADMFERVALAVNGREVFEVTVKNDAEKFVVTSRWLASLTAKPVVHSNDVHVE